MKIISGSQTGVDRGALDAALELSIESGGTCPAGRRAEDGVIPEKYPLTEFDSTVYFDRTRQNVVDSDATLVFTYGRPSGGSMKTIEFAVKYGRPWHHIDLNLGSHDDHVDEICKWLSGSLEDDPGPKPPEQLILNVAGSRGLAYPELQETVMQRARLGFVRTVVALTANETLNGVFVARAREVGFRQAVRERDDPFEDYGSRPKR